MLRSLLLGTIAISLVGCGPLELIQGGVQGSGKTKTETRKIASFNTIEHKMGANVDVRIGNKSEVVITSDDNLLPLITTEVKDGKLTIASESNLRSKSKLRIEVTTPSLDGFELSGAGNVELDGINAEKFVLELNGAGNVTATGLVRELEATLRGAGNMQLFGLRAQRIMTTLNGAGNIEVHAIESLDATLNGAGNIRYQGKPTLNAKRNGAGSIKAD